MRRFAVAIVPDEEDGGYVASVPSLPGVHDQGETVEEALANVTEAIRFTLENMAERGESLPTGEDTAHEIELTV